MGRCSVVGAANILVTQSRVFHRLPTGALLSEGIAPVDSPWKTLFDHPLHLQLPNQTSPFSTAATRATSTTRWAAESRPAGALKRAMFRSRGGCRWPRMARAQGAFSTGRPRARSPNTAKRRWAGGGKRGAGSCPGASERTRDPRQAGAARTANPGDHIAWPDAPGSPRSLNRAMFALRAPNGHSPRRSRPANPGHWAMPVLQPGRQASACAGLPLRWPQCHALTGA